MPSSLKLRRVPPMASSLAHPPQGWPGVVVSHLRPRILWPDAAFVEPLPIAFPHHARQKALAHEKRLNVRRPVAHQCAGVEATTGRRGAWAAKGFANGHGPR
jgi:hypothetical protein